VLAAVAAGKSVAQAPAVRAQDDWQSGAEKSADQPAAQAVRVQPGAAEVLYIPGAALFAERSCGARAWLESPQVKVPPDVKQGAAEVLPTPRS
jgi:hypothetical protein